MIRDPSDGSVKLTPQTIDKLRAKYGPNWGLNTAEPKRKPPERAPTNEELIEFYRTNPERIARLMGEGVEE